MGEWFDIKPAFVFLLKPFVGKLKAWGVNPYHMKAAAFLGSLLTGLLLIKFSFYGAWLLLIPWWLLLRAVLNTFDSLLAEDLKFKGRLFLLMDEVCDVFSDVVLFLPLFIVVPWAALPIISFVIGFVMVEFCGVLGLGLGASRRQDGPVTKGARAYFIGALALVCSVRPVIILQWPWIFYVATALCVWTCVNRVLGAVKESGE